MQLRSWESSRTRALGTCPSPTGNWVPGTAHTLGSRMKAKELTSSSGAAYRPCSASELDLVVDVRLGDKEASAGVGPLGGSGD